MKKTFCGLLLTILTYGPLALAHHSSAHLEKVEKVEFFNLPEAMRLAATFSEFQTTVKEIQQAPLPSTPGFATLTRLEKFIFEGQSDNEFSLGYVDIAYMYDGTDEAHGLLRIHVLLENGKIVATHRIEFNRLQ
jgi:hypothetical protein